MTVLRTAFCCLLLALVLAPGGDASAQGQKRFKIYAITFRGMTEVERGFQEYFTARRIPVDIVWRDLARDASKMPGFLDEIRQMRPDLIYTWGTSVTLGVMCFDLSTASYGPTTPSVTEVPQV
jgi:putative tryptophan/tyrosine transport system substrate-binding protein